MPPLKSRSHFGSSPSPSARTAAGLEQRACPRDDPAYIRTSMLGGRGWSTAGAWSLGAFPARSVRCPIATRRTSPRSAFATADGKAAVFGNHEFGQRLLLSGVISVQQNRYFRHISYTTISGHTSMPLRACLCASRGGVPRLHAALTTMIGHTRARPCRFRVASGCCRRMAQWHYCSDLCAHKRRFAHSIVFRTRPSHMLGERMPGCAKCRGSPRHTNCSRTLAWVRTAAARSLGYALMPWRIGGARA